MVFYMPGTVDPNATHEAGIEDLTPRQIADELDRFIVGQASAKRAVAIALRNRLRRRRLTPEMAEEVMPKNILMIGPTGVGKTEIARRLARLAGSPFIKLEATKFTEVGYVGRDVESMIRDLVEVGIELIRQEKQREVAPRAKVAVQARLLDLLLPPRTPSRRTDDPAAAEREREDQAAWERSRKAIGDKLESGELEDKEVELEVTSNPMAGMSIFSAAGMEEMDMNMKDMMPGLFQGKAQRRKMSVGEAREILQGEEEEKLIDSDRTARDAIKRVEESGIVFLDEMDKIAGAEASRGPDVSREGVQRDLLPIVEGTLVKTKHGMVRTDHILFVAAGAFHLSKPSDLIPELQGRFPIRVELESLGEAELVRILTEPESSLVKQYVALMETEGVTLDFTDDGVRAIAAAATQVNEHTENIGARRLLTIMERLLDEVSFAGSEWKGQTIRVDADYVQERLADVAGDADISRFVL